MKLSTSILFALSIAIFASGCATPRGHQKIPPSKEFRSEYLNVVSPQDDGWFQQTAAPAGVVFAKSGLAESESLVAQAVLFKLPETDNNKEFASAVIEGAKSGSPPERYEIIIFDTKLNNTRPYPCVDIHTLAIDKKALTKSGSREAMQLEIIAIYCKHPALETTGFMAGYSHRGYTRYPNITSESKQFIHGVLVPNH